MNCAFSMWKCVLIPAVVHWSKDRAELVHLSLELAQHVVLDSLERYGWLGLRGKKLSSSLLIRLTETMIRPMTLNQFLRGSPNLACKVWETWLETLTPIHPTLLYFLWSSWSWCCWFRDFKLLWFIRSTALFLSERQIGEKYLLVHNSGSEDRSAKLIVLC